MDGAYESAAKAVTDVLAFVVRAGFQVESSYNLFCSAERPE